MCAAIPSGENDTSGGDGTSYGETGNGETGNGETSSVAGTGAWATSLLQLLHNTDNGEK